MTTSRRDFLKKSSLAGASIFLPLGLWTQSASAARPYVAPVSPTLTKYVDQLPVPGSITPTVGPVGALSLSMAKYNTYKFHRDLGAAETFGYGGALYLGPTIIATRGQPINATFTNNLTSHPLASTLAMPDPLNVLGVQAADVAAPRASVHLHGGYNAAMSDGGPMEFFPRNAAPFNTNSYTYNWANDQQAATLWYHDHAFGLTRANVYCGLAAYYLLRDEFDTGQVGNPLGLPAPYGSYEIPLVLQDKSFKLNGTLFYSPTPAWIPEFFGDVAVINGKAWPNFNVEQAVYRFRIINGSEARFYNVSLSNGGNIYQIGTESGLLDAPVPMPSLLIAPGERVDILVDFTTAVVGDKILLLNNAVTPFPGGKRTNRAGGSPLPELMQFSVTAAAGAGAVTTLPVTLRGGAGQPPLLTQLSAIIPTLTTPPRQRYLALFEVAGPAGPVAAIINILGFDESQNGPNAISDNIGAGGAAQKDTLEQWNIINLTGDTHPMHLHMVNFQLLGRQSFNATQYLKDFTALAGTRAFTAMGVTVQVPDTTATALLDPTPYLRGRLVAPPANEMGWKDTIMCPPGQVTSLLVPFGNDAIGTGGTDAIPFGRLVSGGAGVYSAFGGPFAGTYVWHCHILDHEENDMMNDFQVV